MTDPLEEAIERAMEAVFGDDENAVRRARPFNCNPHFLQMLTVAGGQDYDACDLIERHLELESKITGFRDQVAMLMTRHNGDEGFKAKCRAAFKARADLIVLQQQTLLADWPGLRHAGRPM
jgi:hypothetical protein